MRKMREGIGVLLVPMTWWLAGLGLTVTACGGDARDTAPEGEDPASALLGTWATREGNDRLTLEFREGGVVLVTLARGDETRSAETTYEEDGDAVVVRIPGERDLELRWRDGALEGSAGGRDVRFERR